MKWIVYCTINVVNNKVYYGVHKTKNPDVFDGYLGCGVQVNSPSSYNKRQTPFHCAVAKYGPAKFKRTVVKVFNNGKDAYKLEEEIVTPEFIKKWDTMQDIADFYYTSHTAVMHAVHDKIGYQNCFWCLEDHIDVTEYKNYTGGTPIYKYDKESGKFIEGYDSIPAAAKANNIEQQRIQAAVKGGYLAGGFYYSKEVMESYKGGTKISIKGKPIYAYTLDGKFVKELNGSKEICEFLGAKHINSVTSSMRQNRPYKNYQLSLEKIDKMEPVVNKRNISKRVGRFDMNGNLLEEYDSITLAQNVYGTGVRRVLKGQQKQCHNFIFKYIS